jgi:hypothetical protein
LKGGVFGSLGGKVAENHVDSVVFPHV